MSALDDYMRSFPLDIREAAWAEVNGSHGNLDSTEGAVTIARAILAERQRANELLEAANGILDGSIQMLITPEASEKLDRLSMAIHSYKSRS
ncbi:hypothetical protein [Agrobacterium tumefaciens]|uniref:hypothetical protein n=1 Tax=Agrobacterium tumefaciens TaxID=358 RepID=UPI003BA1CBA2